MTPPKEITRLGLPATVGKLVKLLEAVEAPDDAIVTHRDGTLRILRAAPADTEPEGNEPPL